MFFVFLLPPHCLGQQLKNIFSFVCLQFWTTAHPVRTMSATRPPLTCIWETSIHRYIHTVMHIISLMVLRKQTWLMTRHTHGVLDLLDERGDAVPRIWPLRTAGQREDHVAQDGRGEGTGEELWLCGLHEQEGCRAGPQKPQRYVLSFQKCVLICFSSLRSVCQLPVI